MWHKIQDNFLHLPLARAMKGSILLVRILRALQNKKIKRYKLFSVPNLASAGADALTVGTFN